MLSMDGLISVNHNQPWSAFYNHSMQLHDCTALEYEPCTVSAFGLPMQYNIVEYISGIGILLPVSTLFVSFSFYYVASNHPRIMWVPFEISDGTVLEGWCQGITKTWRIQLAMTSHLYYSLAWIEYSIGVWHAPTYTGLLFCHCNWMSFASALSVSCMNQEWG